MQVLGMMVAASGETGKGSKLDPSSGSVCQPQVFSLKYFLPLLPTRSAFPPILDQIRALFLH